MSDANKTVLQICLSRGWGGLEMYPIRIGRALQARGWRVLGLALTGSRVAEGMAEAGFELITVGSKGQAMLRLWRLRCRARQAVALHCHKSGDLSLGALLKQSGQQLLFTEHMGGKRSKKDFYHRLIFSRVDRLLAISDLTLARNRQALPVAKEKTTRLWLGTDVTPYPLNESTRAALLADLDLPPRARVIGLIGRLCEGKGQRPLLEAFALLAPRFADLHLLLVGGLSPSEGADPGEAEHLRQLAQSLGVSDRVVFTGLRRDVPALLALLEVACIPSYDEAFGLTVIEAMAAGKAIVGANTGAIPEVLGDCGLTVNPRSPEALAGALSQLLEDDALRLQLAQAARRRAQDTFGMARHLQRLEAYYGAEDAPC